MPAVLGAIKVISVSSGGQFQVGDVGAIVPKTAAKTYSGSGTSNTGDVPRTFNLASTSNTNDADVADGNMGTAT